MKCTLIALTLLASLFIVPTALAHTLERDGSVGAVLHITPNDNPVAGEEAVVGFSVSDTQKRFSARDCRCSLQILKEGKTIATKELPSSLETLYTFPDTGQYTLRLVGTSKSKTFDTFQIDQTIRITSSGTSYASSPIYRVISALLLSVLMIGTSLFTFSRHRHYAPTMNNRERKNS